MKVLVWLSMFVASAAAGFVAYPYVPVLRSPVVHDPFVSGASYPTVYKPVYTGFYDYRLGLTATPVYHPYGVIPGVGPTIVHLVPSEPDDDDDKKKKDKKDKKDKDKKKKDDDDDDKEKEEKEEKKDTEDVETV